MRLRERLGDPLRLEKNQSIGRLTLPGTASSTCNHRKSDAADREALDGPQIL